MLYTQFLTEFSQNFVEQINRIFNIDGYLIYSIDSINHAYDYRLFNISNHSLTEYLDNQIENDPVSFKQHYLNKNKNIELLSQHNFDGNYNAFIQRWQIVDTAEIFFRKRNGKPILGLSIIRENTNVLFTEYDKKILESFYALSKNYFFNHTDSVDKECLHTAYALTKKEILVLENLLLGLNNNAIAESLNCSLATIKTHVQHIYQKTNMNNRQELLCKFLK